MDNNLEASKVELTAPCYNLSMESRQRSIAMTYKKVRIQDQGTDFAFWQTQSFSTRLKIQEEIRQQYIAWKYGTRPRFQRVLSITKRK